MTRIQMAAAHPTYVLPSEVTDDGWYAPGKETDGECRARAKRPGARAGDSVGTQGQPQHVGRRALRLHPAFLDAFSWPETTGSSPVAAPPPSRGDAEQATGVAFMKVNRRHVARPTGAAGVPSRPWATVASAFACHFFRACYVVVAR